MIIHLVVFFVFEVKIAVRYIEINNQYNKHIILNVPEEIYSHAKQIKEFFQMSQTVVTCYSSFCQYYWKKLYLSGRKWKYRYILLISREFLLLK